MPQRLGLAGVLFAAAALASATTYTVTSAADSGAGSLRQAMTDANANPGADTIQFNIVGSGVHTIAPTSALPTITGPVTIDGYTQPGSAPNSRPTGQGLDTVLRIEIDGTSAGAGAGFSISADDVTIRGLVINRFTEWDIQTNATHSGLVVEGCFLGTDAAGIPGPHARRRRSQPAIGQTNGRIGGTTPAARNLISGSSLFFEHINFGQGQTQPVSNSLVAGNLLGTDVTGLTRIASGSFGLTIGGGSNNTIGGTSPTARNVFTDGLFLGGTGNMVQGNFVGLDVTGTIVIGRPSDGVYVYGDGNTVGGSAAGAGNRIGGAINSGVLLFGVGHVVQGNFIGTDETRTVRFPNGYYGIVADVSSSNSTIGGIGPGEGNVVAFNGGGFAGVAVQGIDATVRGNSIFDNSGNQPDSGLGIDLVTGAGFDLGVTLNDALDADAGPNGFQNYPLISSVTYGGATTTVVGTLHSTPSVVFDVDFYSNAVCNGRPQEQPEAQTWLGSIQVTTDGSGNSAFNTALPVAVANGAPITATATSPSGATSELSPRFVLSMSPAAGSPSGLTGAQIRGLAFEAGATVTVGGVPRRASLSTIRRPSRPTCRRSRREPSTTSPSRIPAATTPARCRTAGSRTS